ncbi:MAG TPA: hypothetical protein VFQ80_12740, partial [Thermomicrobiales bacterium]|nr:hypothetical protein [Thermomicrobiales bacterium]
AGRDEVSFARLLWVAPLTVVVALVVNLAIKQIVIALDPSLAHMGQLGRSLIVLTLEGAIAAVAVFAIMALLVPRPIFWFRIVAIVALLLSLLPDIALAIGGAPMRQAMGVIGPLARVGAPPPTGPRPAGPPPGAVLPGAPLEQVLVLMLLHVATAVVCIVLLTTLTRKSAPADLGS